MSAVSKVFTKMIELSNEQKKENLEKAYWDILSVLNLGSDILEKPFGYMTGLNFPIMKEVLLKKNLKMQTLTTLFMNQDQRKQYLKSLTDKSKLEIIQAAAEMTEVSSLEFKTMDSELKNDFRPQSNPQQVPIEMSVQKIAEALSIIDQMEFLPQLDSKTLIQFKRAYPSLAFIHEWPVDKLKMLLSKTMSDEISSFLNLKPDLKDFILENCPPFTAELVRDELASEKIFPREEIEAKLSILSQRVNELVTSKQVRLTEIFSSEVETINAKKSFHVA